MLKKKLKSKKSVIVDAPESSLSMKGKKPMNSLRAMMDGDSSIALKMMKRS